ncbi:MAG: histidine kinase [Prolixibacteraceae bacterium]|nr:histidine kinase [Prolixibacteraceae bacterium]
MKRIFSSIWFLALFISIPVILFLPDVFEKYMVRKETVYRVKNGVPVKNYIVDLDSDGKCERVESFVLNGPPKTFSFQFFSDDGGMVDQVNWPGQFNNDTKKLFFADANNDGHKEIYSFLFENDSLYLQWVQLTPEIGNVNRLPLCPVYTYRDSLYSYSFGNIHCIDLENDGKNELIIPVTGGFSIIPRQFFKVDIENRQVTSSIITGCANTKIQFFDLENDGVLEIIADGEVPPIRKEYDLPCNEPAPYLRVLNHELKDIIAPVKFPSGITSSTRTFPVVINGQPFLNTFFFSRSAECPSFRGYRFDITGNKVDSLVIENVERDIYKWVFKNEKGNFITNVSASGFVEINSNLEIVKELKVKDGINYSYYSQADINEDGIMEYFLEDRISKCLFVFTDQMKRKYEIPVKNQLFPDNDLIKLSKNRFYTAGEKSYTIWTFKKNPFFWLRFPVYLAIYLIGALFFYVIQKMTEARVRKQFELRDQVRELQLKSFRSQLDPHFVFNTFNAIASVIKKGDNETAYKTFMHFSRLIRHTLTDVSSDFIPLEVELQTVTNFIELQKVRFKDLFEYEINCTDKGLKEHNIPRMIIQVHVENAIKHGLRPKKDDGLLTINIGKDAEQMRIEIYDNGIGREASKDLRTHSTGIGTKTMDAFIEHLNKTQKQKIVQKVEDLYHEAGNALGTKVILLIPLGL